MQIRARSRLTLYDWGVRRFLRDRRGATAAEYCVVLVAVLLIVVGAFRLMGSQMSKTSDKATVVFGSSGTGAGLAGNGNTVGGSVGASTPGAAGAAGGAGGASGGDRGGAGTAGNTGPTSGPGVTGGGTAVGNMGASGGGAGAAAGGGGGRGAGGGGGGRSAVGEKAQVATNTQGAGAIVNKGGGGGSGGGGGGGGGGKAYGGGRVLTSDEAAWAAKQNASGGNLEDFGKQKFGRWIALVFLLMGLVIAFFTLKKSKGQMAGGTNAPTGRG